MTRAGFSPETDVSANPGKLVRRIVLTAGAVLTLSLVPLGTAQAQVLPTTGIAAQICLSPGMPATWQTATDVGVLTSWLTTGADGQTYIDTQYPDGSIVAELAVPCADMGYAPIVDQPVVIQPEIVVPQPELVAPQQVVISPDEPDHVHHDNGHHNGQNGNSGHGDHGRGRDH